MSIRFWISVLPVVVVCRHDNFRTVSGRAIQFVKQAEDLNVRNFIHLAPNRCNKSSNTYALYCVQYKSEAAGNIRFGP